MKLKEFDFNALKRPWRPTNLAVRAGSGAYYEGLSIGDTLKMLPAEFADFEIKETRWFFDTFVIELEPAKQCPLCLKFYRGPAAVSRRPGLGDVCPDCGTREALAAAGRSPEQIEDFMAKLAEHKEKLEREGKP